MSEQLTHNGNKMSPFGQAVIEMSLTAWADKAVHRDSSGKEIPIGGEAYVVLPGNEGEHHAL